MIRAILIAFFFLLSISISAQVQVYREKPFHKPFLESLEQEKLMILTVSPGKKDLTKKQLHDFRSYLSSHSEHLRQFIFVFANASKPKTIPPNFEQFLEGNSTTTFVLTPDNRILDRTEGVLSPATDTSFNLARWAYFQQTGVLSRLLQYSNHSERGRDFLWVLAEEMRAWKMLDMRKEIMAEYGRIYSPLDWLEEMDRFYFLREIDSPAHPEMARFFDNAAEIDGMFPGIVKTKLSEMTLHYILYGNDYTAEELESLKRNAYKGIQVIEPDRQMDFDTFVREWLPVKLNIDLD